MFERFPAPAAFDLRHDKQPRTGFPLSSPKHRAARIQEVA
jgi:hypothetical protein